MISIEGLLSDGKTSRQYNAWLRVSSDTHLILAYKSKEYFVPLSKIDISPRLANTSRYIDLPEGRRFVTLDNDAVDLLEGRLDGTGTNRLLHRLESRFKYVFATLLLLVAFSWGFIQYGLPALSEGIAYILPTNVSQSVGHGAMKLLDKWALSPSELTTQRQNALRARLSQVIPEDSEYNFELVFRKGKGIGANAFALPDGTIVFTDEIVQSSRHDDELVTVMAHEVGHVVKRHSLRRLIQDSGMAFILVAITGDVSGSSSILLALPTLLIEASYSQDYEREADRYALAYIQRHQISGEHFLNLMNRLAVDELKRAARRDENSNRVLDYFSSHPPTDERIRMFSGN